MMRAASRGARLLAALSRGSRDDSASQIVEFALSLPLLVLFIVGIFDFSGAISLKQKLTNAAREGARVAAADPANDLGNSSGVPASVSDAFQVVDNYLISEKINDCGLAGMTPVQTSGTLTWSSPSLTGCPGGTGLQLTVNRGCITHQPISPTIGTVAMVNTCVTILYPYKWQFNSVASLFAGKFAGPANITTTATAFNEN